MKLYYYVRGDKIDNFGDSLNPWLWNQLIPTILDDDETTAFVGIGTIINDFLFRRIPNAKQTVIFSSGVGYIEDQSLMPSVDRIGKIYCLRGKLSARKLGLPDELGIADGALLVKRLYQVKEKKEYQFAFMPHIDHALLDNQFWIDVCQQADMLYINPSLHTEDILSLINRTEVILTEAMHGAIVAEALRTPWIPLVTSSRILEFKWQDWCDSINLDYNPAYIKPLVSCYPFDASKPRFNENWIQDLNSENSNIRNAQIDLIAQQLVNISQEFSPNLGNDNHIENLVIQLEEKLEQFKADYS